MNKLNGIQGLRAIAFLAIFISHTTIGDRAGMGGLGAWGVSIFFVLSGFVMIYSYLPRNEICQSGIKFAYQKIHKLYPLHIVTMLGMFVLFAAAAIIEGGKVLGKLFVDLLLQTALIQIWIPNPKYYVILSGVSWYLCACAFCYFCFPWIWKNFKKLKKESVAILGMCLLFLMQIGIAIIAGLFGNYDVKEAFSMQWITYNFPLSRLVDFLIGCCLGYVFLRNKEHILHKQWITISEMIVIILIVVSWIIYAKEYSILGSQCVKYTLLFTPTTVALIWFAARGEGVFSKLLGTSLFVKIGNLSPYTFLIHFVVIRYITAFNIKILHNLVSDFFVAVIALICTYVATYIWMYIEKCVWKGNKKQL